MARRIKEEPEVHRMRIADAAEQIFMEKGIGNTSMDAVAKAAGYSKATLYVYFKNKEELVDYLVLRSITYLKDYIVDGITKYAGYEERFYELCRSMVRYQRKYPYYFSLVLQKIEFDTGDASRDNNNAAYYVGEQINECILQFIEDGIKAGEYRDDIADVPTLFGLWGMISGIINIAVNKEEYIGKTMCLSADEFMERNFKLLYESIRKKNTCD